ncbi:MAG: leucyl/phenylalanyl-tRNA--protein transferase [Desulfuromonadales bacterium]|nr:leucyl/phenylalanyl-tRNA--protein transferase [Desulfuromonadales bacterium]
MPIFRLSDKLAFPDPRLASPEGLLAVGGDLSPERLLLAYSLGIFPWYGSGEPLLWWSPDPRCVIFPEQVHVSRRLERTLRQGGFRITSNAAFEQVVAACAEIRVQNGEGTWLVPEMQAAYRRLHLRGYAHSVEAWQDGELVGGIYGVILDRFFFGESMFHRVTDASKVVLVKLCHYLAAHRFELLDCQVPNPHLFRMGAVQMSRAAFLDRLYQNSLRKPGRLPRVLLPAEL